MTSKVTLKLAEELLDRFFRDAEGQPNRNIDLAFLLEDMGTSYEKAEPALEYLASRGLLLTYTGDKAVLTERGTQAIAQEQDIKAMPKYQPEWGGGPAAAAPPSAPAPTPSTPPRPYRPTLSYTDGDGRVHVYDLAWQVVIGRSDEASLKINDQRASKRHVEIRYAGDCYLIRDLGSANGTMVNGHYVESQPLRHGDRVLVGRTEILYACPQVMPEPGGEPPPELASSLKKQPSLTPAAAAKRPEARSAAPAPAAPSAAPPSRSGSGVRVVRGMPAAPARKAPTSGSELFEVTERPSRSEDADLFADSALAGPEPTGDLFGPDSETSPGEAADSPELEATILRPVRDEHPHRQEAPPAEEEVSASEEEAPAEVEASAFADAELVPTIASIPPPPAETSIDHDTNVRDEPPEMQAAAEGGPTVRGDLETWSKPPPQVGSEAAIEAFDEKTPVEAAMTPAGVSEILAVTSALPEAESEFSTPTPPDVVIQPASYAQFTATLQALRNRISEAGPPDADRLLDAIDTLRRHPGIRAALGA